mmetsp:Transcript_69075/g.136960  ORF Transcript_69075/g.136960 Transcript_69075/m.136960 type:complete len:283 (+) Transcript_69075:166-1014(+)
MTGVGRGLPHTNAHRWLRSNHLAVAQTFSSTTRSLAAARRERNVATRTASCAARRHRGSQASPHLLHHPTRSLQAAAQASSSTTTRAARTIGVYHTRPLATALIVSRRAERLTLNSMTTRVEDMTATCRHHRRPWPLIGSHREGRRDFRSRMDPPPRGQSSPPAAHGSRTRSRSLWRRSALSRSRRTHTRRASANTATHWHHRAVTLLSPSGGAAMTLAITIDMPAGCKVALWSLICPGAPLSTVDVADTWASMRRRGRSRHHMLRSPYPATCPQSSAAPPL